MLEQAVAQAPFSVDLHQRLGALYEQLGQVHRARLKSGEVVAVKVQPAGILAKVRHGFADRVLNPEVDIVGELVRPGDGDDVLLLEVHPSFACLGVHEHHRYQEQKRESEQRVEQEVDERIGRS